MSKDNMKDALEALTNISKQDGLKEKIEELGKDKINSDDLERIKNMASKLKNDYKDKSEDELFEEIEKVKDTMNIKDLKKTLIKNRKTVKQLYNMMDGEQKKRMERILEMLKDNK